MVPSLIKLLLFTVGLELQATWLSFMLTAQYPKLVAKLVLVGSGPFKPEYASRDEFYQILCAELGWESKGVI